jgi:hypothetical protein
MMWRAKWKLWVAIALSILMAGYIVQFVNSGARNKPALFFAWACFLAAVSVYRWYRTGIVGQLEARKKLREEAEFQEWMKRKEAA